MKRPYQKFNGFTLLEVIFAMMICSLMLTAMYQVVSYAILASKVSSQIQRGIVVAESSITRACHDLKHERLNDETHKEGEFSVKKETISVRSIDLGDEASRENQMPYQAVLTAITITVSWRWASQIRTWSLNTKCLGLKMVNDP